MSEKCTDISQNITKLSFPGDNLGYTTEIDGRENKEDFLNFPFDHMYACNSDNSDLNSDRQAGESEVRHLKDLLLLHLDLIQQQSDEIVNKDKYIAQLRQENELLKQRLDRMEHRVTQNNKNNTHIHSSNNSFSLDAFSDNMTHDTGFCADTEDSKDNLKVMGLCNEESEYKTLISTVERRSADRDSGGDSMGPSDRCYSNRRTKIGSATNTAIKENIIKLDTSKLETQKIPESFHDSTINNVPNTQIDLQNNHLNTNSKETRQLTLRPNDRRKRLCSSSSQLSTNESLASASDDRGKSGSNRKRRKGTTIKRVSILTTDSPYVIQTGALNSSLPEDLCEPIDVNNSTNLEVPRWRVKMYTSCYSMEGTENLDDDVFNRRHIRLENDERRRKRWDVQRIREQRHIERLRQRQERQSKSEEQNEPLSSFWPSLEDIQYIEVTDELPVSAFGTPIPKIAPSEFRLPWLNGTVQTKKQPNKKSTTRRKSQKR